jgi:hypothetical protein
VEVQIVTLGSIKGFSSKVHIFHEAWAKEIKSAHGQSGDSRKPKQITGKYI